MDDALETDQPQKKIHNLVVPTGWTDKVSSDGKCFICKNDFDDINLAWFKNPVWFGEKSGHVICGGSCWAEYTGISEHCKLCVAWKNHLLEADSASEEVASGLVADGQEEGKDKGKGKAQLRPVGPSKVRAQTRLTPLPTD